MSGLPVLIPIEGTTRQTIAVRYFGDSSGWGIKDYATAWPDVGETLQSAYYPTFGADGPPYSEFQIQVEREWCEGWFYGRTSAGAPDGRLDKWTFNINGQTFVEWLEAFSSYGFSYRWIVAETKSWSDVDARLARGSRNFRGFCWFMEGLVVYDEPGGSTAYQDALDWIDAHY